MVLLSINGKFIIPISKFANGDNFDSKNRWSSSSNFGFINKANWIQDQILVNHKRACQLNNNHISNSKNVNLSRKLGQVKISTYRTRTDPDGPEWTPYNKPCHTFYQTLSHLVPDFITPCTRLCHTF